MKVKPSKAIVANNPKKARLNSNMKTIAFGSWNPLHSAGSSRLNTGLAGFLFLILMTYCLQSAYANMGDTDSIGVARLVIGPDATVIRNDKNVPLQSEAGIVAGDTIQTGEATHVHIKFTDGAVASIRPNSKVTIQCYQTSPQQPLCIKFNLLKGTMRKVSGATSQAHKDKFRLNTPVAAIGVRGTDFITTIDSHGATTVRVIQGAIAVSPFVEGCSAAGLGECQTSLTTLLSENDPFMINVRQGQAPEYIELDQQLAAARANQAEEDVKRLNASRYTRMNDVIAILKDDPQLVQEYLQQVGVENEVELSDVVLPETVPVMDEYEDTPLVFGSWNSAGPGIAVPYNQAQEGREVTVGNQFVALWREAGVYQPPSGVVDYDLKASSAFLFSADAVTSAQVQNGQLSINFDQGTLSTSLNVVPDSIDKTYYFSAKHNFNRNDGIFAISSEDGRIAAGAISNDGSEVGYMLQQPVAEGQLQVQTIWHAQ